MTKTASFPASPDEPEGIRRLRAQAELIMREHDARMAPIRTSLNNGVLADLQRVTEKMQAAFAPSRAALDSVISPEVRLMLQEVHARHEALFANVKAIAPAADLVPVFETQATTTVSVESSATVSVESSATPGVDSSPPRTLSSTSQRLTREQTLAAISLLASLHAYLMNLRRADLADYGTLALLFAAMMLILALETESDG